jgi:hypothetical protein
VRKNSRLELQTRLTSAEVLSRIEQAAARESLPFISPSRYPQQREKDFVASISGSRFRLWKVPSSSRIRQNTCIPYFHGEVSDVAGGSEVKGTFALHPFNKLLVVMPLLIVPLPWFFAEKTTATTIFLSLWSLIFVAFAIAVIGTIRLLRAQEERDIAVFLSSLVNASVKGQT